MSKAKRVDVGGVKKALRVGGKISKNEDCCCEDYGECSTCCAMNNLLVNVSGVQDCGLFAGFDCSSVNGRYELMYGGSDATYCYWYYNYPPGAYEINLYFKLKKSDCSYQLNVDISGSYPVLGVGCFEGYGNAGNCSDLEDCVNSLTCSSGIPQLEGHYGTASVQFIL